MQTIVTFDPKQEKLKVRSSVYPEGYGTIQGYNALYEDIYNSDKKTFDKKKQHLASQN